MRPWMHGLVVLVIALVVSAAAQEPEYLRSPLLRNTSDRVYGQVELGGTCELSSNSVDLYRLDPGTTVTIAVACDHDAPGARLVGTGFDLDHQHEGRVQYREGTREFPAMTSNNCDDPATCEFTLELGDLAAGPNTLVFTKQGTTSGYRLSNLSLQHDAPAGMVLQVWVHWVDVVVQPDGSFEAFVPANRPIQLKPQEAEHD